ncbi:MAG: hypothetical protein ACO1RT_05550 [Planctomycetaceae bacterium]
MLESGLPDLLTVKLSQDQSIHFVERERLQEATRELQLDSLLKADHIQQRLQLGKTLGAESLLVLSAQRREGRQVLRVVVCDSTHGVRLWDGRFLNDKNIEHLADQCVAVVAEVRQRFAGGIRRIFAVPAFLSTDFEQRFNYLQSRHRDALANALTTRAGVAVVEIEEARAILRELGDTLSTGLERPIASIVEGTYRVTPPDDNRQRHVELQIEWSHGEQRQLIKQSLPLGKARQWLTTSLAQRLFDEGESGDDPLSAEAQKAILARHAQRFAELGDWEHSISLREAALVYEPSDALQRGLLICEYQYNVAAIVDANWHPARFTKNLQADSRAAALQQAADDYEVGLTHLEYLVRNQLIARADAIGLFSTHCWYRVGNVGEAMWSDPVKHNAMQPACVAQRRFLREFGSDIDGLPSGRQLPERMSTPFYGMQYPVLQHVLSDVVFNNYSAESLECLRYVLEELLPADAQASGSVLSLVNRSFSPEQRLDLDAYREARDEVQEQRRVLQEKHQAARDDQTRRQLEEQLQALQPPVLAVTGAQQTKARDQWRSYLRSLTESDRDVVKLYGYWGLLTDAGREHSSPSRGRAESISTLIEHVERYVAAAGQLNDNDQQSLALLETNIGMMKNRLALASSPSSASQPPASPSDASNSVPSDSVPSESFGRMQFDPVSLVVEEEPDSAAPPVIQGMLQCGKSCDVFWTKDRFFVMHQPGVLRELQLTESTADHALYWGVTWDGECIWLYAHGQGVIALRPDGTRLATFNQTEHVPGYWKGFSLLGLSPRRAIMVASFGQTNRAWCGILEVDERGEQSVNVFYEAKYVAEGRQPQEAAADLKTGFQPAWIHRLQSHNGKDCVIIGRRGLSGALQIDLDTLEASISPYNIRASGRHAFFSHDGHLLASLGGNQLVHYSPPGNDGAVRSRVLSAITPYVDQLLLHEGWLYVPGRVWLRLDPEQRVPERLQPWPTRLPVRYQSLHGGVSAHFGLIAYDIHNPNPSLYQIKVVDVNAEDRAKGGRP